MVLHVDDFAYLQQYGREGARGNQKLRMGAFGHGPNLAGDLSYPGETGLLDTLDEELRWFDFWLKEEENGVTDEPPVHYYQMASARRGAASHQNKLKIAQTWPPNGSRRMHLYLGFNGKLAPAPSGHGDTASHFIADPGNPVPTLGGANLMLPIGPEDQRTARGRPDVLRFETPALERNIVVTGEVFADLHVSTDAPDTDFAVKLVDVYPDGYEALILDSILRARYRNGRRVTDIAPMPNRKIQQISIPLGQTANVFEAGHRIALHVSSSNYPRFDVNPNTGASPSAQDPKMRIANNAVHHDARNASALVLTVIDAPDTGASDSPR